MHTRQDQLSCILMKALSLLFTAILVFSSHSFADEKGSFKNIDAEAAKALLADAEKKIVVLDVRTPSEYEAGHLKGAKVVDFRASDFETKLAELDKSQSYLLHCRSGGRSSNAFAIMKKLGFKSVYHLDGGMIAWEEAGGDVEK